MESKTSLMLPRIGDTQQGAPVKGRKVDRDQDRVGPVVQILPKED
jgi:hypothetical protein